MKDKMESLNDVPNMIQLGLDSPKMVLPYIARDRVSLRT